MPSLERAAEAADADSALRAFAERMAGAEDWQGLVGARDELAVRAGALDAAEGELASRLRMAVEECNEQLVSLAPPRWAATALGFALDRLERDTLADRYTWTQLEPWLTSDEHRRGFAYERMVRGEDLSSAGLERPPGAPPFALQQWEPRYWLHAEEAYD